MPLTNPSGGLPGQTLRAAVIVARPADETAWCGGLMLRHPEWRWTVVSLCRGDAPEATGRFYRALRRLGAVGNTADLDGGAEHKALPAMAVGQAVLRTLPRVGYDLVVTHGEGDGGSGGMRGAEVGRVVAALWRDRRVTAERLWHFASGSGADLSLELSEAEWRLKRTILAEVYGMPADGPEPGVAPRAESFRCLDFRWRDLRGGERAGAEGRDEACRGREIAG